jgi:hypothetical protein
MSVLAAVLLVAIVVGVCARAARFDVTWDDQLPPDWRPVPGTVIQTNHLTGGRTT